MCWMCSSRTRSSIGSRRPVRDNSACVPAPATACRAAILMMCWFTSQAGGSDRQLTVPSSPCCPPSMRRTRTTRATMSGGSLRARGGACSVLDRITHAHPTRASFRAPRAKIRRAKHKLECANPCSVMLQELSENRTVAKLQGYFPAVRAMWLHGPPTTLPHCVMTMVCVAV